MSEYEVRTTKLTVNKIGEPIFSENATHIEIEDEASGEFIVITQCNDLAREGQKISIGDKDEWQAIKTAVETMMATIK